MELIPIKENDNGKVVVSGRELHEFLEIKTQYTKWFNRMSEYGFEENTDFSTISQKRLTAQGNQTEYLDHALTISMAKEISMIQRNEKGKQARRYFIQVEEAWNSPEMIMKRALQIADKKIVSLEEKIEQDKPKTIFADAVNGSVSSCLVKELSTLLKQNGIDIGQNRLFDWLRENGYLCQSGRRKNHPTQRSMDLKIMEVREHIRTDSSGNLKTKFTPLITGKGQQYFINKFLNEKELIEA